MSPGAIVSLRTRSVKRRPCRETPSSVTPWRDRRRTDSADRPAIRAPSGTTTSRRARSSPAILPSAFFSFLSFLSFSFLSFSFLSFLSFFTFFSPPPILVTYSSLRAPTRVSIPSGSASRTSRSPFLISWRRAMPGMRFPRRTSPSMVAPLSSATSSRSRTRLPIVGDPSGTRTSAT